MPKNDRIGELVDLCEEAQSLAAELNLDFIAFLANMVVLEARQAHYFSDENADEETTTAHTRPSRHRGSAQQPEWRQAPNVTQLSAYRDAWRLKRASAPSQESPDTNSQSV